MKQNLVPVKNPGAITLRRSLTPAQFGDLADVPPELEWFAMHDWANPEAVIILCNTRRSAKMDSRLVVADFVIPATPEYTAGKWHDLNMLLTLAEVIEVSYSSQSTFFQGFQKPRFSIIYAWLNNDSRRSRAHGCGME